MKVGQSEIFLQRGDITKLSCDAIVNAANSSLLGGGGVDGAIHQAAGPQLLAACRKLHGCQTGEAKITPGFKLPARYVIHTVGPIYQAALKPAQLLAACYSNSLDLAYQYQLKKVAFPAISTGVYGYPLKLAVPIAVDTVRNWLRQPVVNEYKIIFCCYDQRTWQAYQNYFKQLTA
ncbi:O-acetyl-ADP-ribose deacetylase [Liquorilactobacillus sicerae]|uniref:O-acetyl-ADP-ribose deacetylase n=1 Tax=Liquorilactobacillus sicerae TaxID=1416943 RepID=UPI00248099D7|nr:O-acetyl-ADP-ribose deacetylase [Liquorilactobacillus sicerae]